MTVLFERFGLPGLQPCAGNGVIEGGKDRKDNDYCRSLAESTMKCDKAPIGPGSAPANPETIVVAMDGRHRHTATTKSASVKTT